MKRLLIAATAGLLIFGGQTAAEASDIDTLDLQGVQIEENGGWADFRDKVILNRETDKERRKREEWERHHRQPPPSPPPRGGYGAPPPPPPPRPGYGAPPPRPGYGAPPPPPYRR